MSANEVPRETSASYDVVVVGGGHAGCEAAAAASRLGARVALVTMNLAVVGAMSCNPAIGGVGKGHLVREVDACDGLIARAADDAAIHHRMLNASKGAAVRGPRVQADRDRFARSVQAQLRRMARVDLLEGEVEGWSTSAGRVSGVRLTDGRMLRTRALVLATGTFMRGRLYHGLETSNGGRVAERSATRLADQVRDAGLPVRRLKTGTPPRLDGRTIDWATLESQPSDVADWRMSIMSQRGAKLPQVACAITRTNEQTHDLIRNAADRSPLFAGSFEGRGPRYCPSIEDKIIRFGDRDGHQIFLEPEGLDSHLVYPNGISTSLPFDVQQQFVRSIAGLGAAVIDVPGYAVEYDHVDPRALDHSLAVRDHPGLYLAGQVNGTTGYEEAAAQGLVAGLNGACFAMGDPPIIFDRGASYIGVMVDDLTLSGVTEPYRMLTARAENRLALRSDNAEQRLTAWAAGKGFVGEARRIAAEHRKENHAGALKILSEAIDAQGCSAGEVARGGQLQTCDLIARFGLPDSDVMATALEDVRYAPYLERQRREQEAETRSDAIILPDALRFGDVPGLSAEMIERLETARPSTLGQATRVPGITPAAISAVLVAARRHV